MSLLDKSSHPLSLKVCLSLVRRLAAKLKLLVACGIRCCPFQWLLPSFPLCVVIGGRCGTSWSQLSRVNFVRYNAKPSVWEVIFSGCCQAPFLHMWFMKKFIHMVRSAQESTCADNSSQYEYAWVFRMKSLAFCVQRDSALGKAILLAASNNSSFSGRTPWPSLTEE